MAKARVCLEHSAVTPRRTYWQNLYESAVVAGDAQVAACALRYVVEYDMLIALIKASKKD